MIGLFITIVLTTIVSIGVYQMYLDYKDNKK